MKVVFQERIEKFVPVPDSNLAVESFHLVGWNHVVVKGSCKVTALTQAHPRSGRVLQNVCREHQQFGFRRRHCRQDGRLDVQVKIAPMKIDVNPASFEMTAMVRSFIENDPCLRKACRSGIEFYGREVDVDISRLPQLGLGIACSAHASFQDDRMVSVRLQKTYHFMGYVRNSPVSAPYQVGFSYQSQYDRIWNGNIFGQQFNPAMQ